MKPFTGSFIRGFTLKDLEATVIVPGILEALDVSDGSSKGSVVMTLDGLGFSEFDHDLGLTIGPGMVGLGGLMLYLQPLTDKGEQGLGPYFAPTVSHPLKSKLFAIVSQDAVDAIGEEL